MSKLEYLEDQRNMAYHNLMCYSRNLSMTRPKEGKEKEWNEAKEVCLIVESLIAGVEGKPDGPVIGAAVINGEVVHNWKQVLESAQKVIEL